MPRVPSTQGRTVGVAPAQNPFANLSGDTGLTALGTGIQNLANAGDDVALALQVNQEDTDRAEAKRLEGEYRARARQIMFGDAKNPGYFTQNGQIAVEGLADHNKRLEQARLEVGETASNQQAASFYSISTTSLFDDDVTQMQRHALKENEVAKGDASAARVSNMKLDGVNSYNDDNEVSLGLTRAEAEITVEGRRLGEDAQVTLQKLQTYRSTYGKELVMHAVQQQDIPRAQELMDVFSDDMSPGDLATAQDHLDEGVLFGQANEATAKILAMGLNEQDSLKEVGKLKDKEVADRVTRNLRNDFAARERDGKAAEDALKSESYKAVQEQTATVDQLLADPVKGPALRSVPGLIPALRKAEDQTIKGQEFGVSNPSLFGKLMALPPEELGRFSAEELRSNLSEDEFSKIQAVQTAQRKTVEEQRTNRAAFNQDQKWLDAASPNSVNYLDPQGKEDQALAQTVRNEFSEWKSGVLDSGRVPTPDESREQARILWTEVTQRQADQGVLSRMLDNVLEFTGVSDVPNVAQYRESLTPEEKKTWTPGIQNVPDDFRTEIENDLRTDWNIPNASPDLINEIAGGMFMGSQKRVQDAIAGASRDTRRDNPRVPRRVNREPADALTPAPAPAPVVTEPEEEVTGALEVPNTTLVDERGPQLASEEEVLPASEPDSQVADFVDSFLPSIISTARADDGDTGVAEGTGQFAAANGPISDADFEGATPLESQVADHEGFSNVVYRDSEGIETIGVGFNLRKEGAQERIEELGLDFEAVLSGDQLLDDAQVQVLFEDDLLTAEEDAKTLFPGFESFSETRQMAFIDMAFNLGRERLGGFENMIEAANAGNWVQAAAEARNSKWFNQVGRRGRRIVGMIRGGGREQIRPTRAPRGDS
jgi:lysozyme